MPWYVRCSDAVKDTFPAVVMHLIRKGLFSTLALVSLGCAGQTTSGSTAAKPAAAGGTAAPGPARHANGGRAAGPPTATPSAPGAAQSASAAPARAGLDSVALLATIRAILDSLPAQTALHAKHLTTGREIAVRADVPVNTASVIKIPIMILAYRDVEASGPMILEARRLIGPDDLRRGSGLLQAFEIGLNPTWRDLITQISA
jgi:beta-lactamase class A